MKTYRGSDVVTGKSVYGRWRPFGKIPCIELWDGSLCEIEPGSLERRIGRDKRGREIYKAAQEVYDDEESL